jgi:hypothetical protein
LGTAASYSLLPLLSLLLWLLLPTPLLLKMLHHKLGKQLGAPCCYSYLLLLLLLLLLL